MQDAYGQAADTSRPDTEPLPLFLARIRRMSSALHIPPHVLAGYQPGHAERQAAVRAKLLLSDDERALARRIRDRNRNRDRSAEYYWRNRRKRREAVA